MRVWDVCPGYLDRMRLLGEHREVHAIASVLAHGKAGYSRHPETIRWRGFGDALAVRHRVVVAEMALRGHRGERTPIALRAGTAPGPEGWPAAFVTPPAEQVLLLARKQAGGPGGRIPLPRSAIDLWAHHKYSVMARDPAAYREIGRRLARRLPEDAFVPLIEELVAFLRVPPSAGRILNAIEHMWGHVSRHASPEEAAAALTGGAAALLATTQSLATRHGERFLLASTALSDLAAWF